jgi:hypothetical protein
MAVGTAPDSPPGASAKARGCSVPNRAPLPDFGHVPLFFSWIRRRTVSKFADHYEPCALFSSLARQFNKGSLPSNRLHQKTGGSLAGNDSSEASSTLSHGRLHPSRMLSRSAFLIALAPDGTSAAGSSGAIAALRLSVCLGCLRLSSTLVDLGTLIFLDCGGDLYRTKL